MASMNSIDYLDANRPNWRTEPVADLVAWTKTEVKVSNPTRINTIGLMAALSVADAGMVFATLNAAAASDALVNEGLLQLRGDGLDFSHASTIALINLLFSGNQSLIDTLLALGEKQSTHIEQMGFSGTMTDSARTDMLNAWGAA